MSALPPLFFDRLPVPSCRLLLLLRLGAAVGSASELKRRGAKPERIGDLRIDSDGRVLLSSFSRIEKAFNTAITFLNALKMVQQPVPASELVLHSTAQRHQFKRNKPSAPHSITAGTSAREGGREEMDECVGMWWGRMNE